MASGVASPTPTISVSPPRPQALRARVSFTSMSSDDYGARSTVPSLSKLPPKAASSEAGRKSGRSRSSSLLSVHEIRDNYDDQLDQGVGPNLNAEWVHYKGAPILRGPSSASARSDRTRRGLDDPSHPHHVWKDSRRHRARDHPGSELDYRQR